MSIKKSESLKDIFKSAEVVSYKKEAVMRSHAYILLIVFGLFVSAFIYVAATQLVKSRINESLQRLTQDTVKTYVNRAEAAIKQFDAVTKSFEETLRAQSQTPELLENRTLDLASQNIFEFVALLQPNQGLNLLANKEGQPVPAVLQAGAIDAERFESILHEARFMINKTQISSSRAFLDRFSHLSNVDAAGAQDLMFVKQIKIQGQLAWMMATLDGTSLFKSRTQIENAALNKISIRETATGDIAYSFSSPDAHSASGSYPEQRKTVSIGGSRWLLTMDFAKSNILLTLEQVPLFTLLIGLFFTIVSSFLVRAQIKQEGQIKNINHILEERNKALQKEMDQREKLNWNLKKSEEENLALVNSISDIIFETDSKGYLVFVNTAWGRITGFDVQQSRGKNLFNLLHPDDQECELEKFETLIRGQKAAYRSTTRLRGIDGTFRAVELSISMVRRSSKGIIHVVGSITDIEERRRAERALGEAEKKYRTIVENAVWGIYQMTPEGIYISVNPAMIDILGYKNVEDMLHSIHDAHKQIYGNRAERRAFLHEVEVNGAINKHETRVWDKNGQALWVSENIRAVKDDDNNVLYYEGSFEDITDRKESDLLLKDAKIHSDMANRAKSEFLTNMSHELRTPLNAIIGFSEIIKTESFGPIGHESYKEYINEIYEGGKKLLNIINEILDISRIEVRARELSESTVDPSAIMEVCISLLKSKAHTNQVDVVNMLENVPAVIAEERAMKQIFMNILSNAIKFTPRGGRVTLRNELSAAGDLSISITDTGVGLDADEIKKALSAFGQVGSSLDQDHAGTGLGLTLVKALVDLHDGKLDIFSQKGMGTTVTVKIPAKRVLTNEVATRSTTALAQSITAPPREPGGQS